MEELKPLKHRCPDCGKEFDRAQALGAHRNAHSGARAKGLNDELGRLRKENAVLRALLVALGYNLEVVEK